MPDFVVPYFSSDTVGTDSEESVKSFNTAEAMSGLPPTDLLHTEEVMDDAETGFHASNQNGSEISHVISLVNRMEERDRQREAQITTLQNCITNMMSIIQEQTRAKEQITPPTNFKPSFPESSNEHVPLGNSRPEGKGRMEPFKWPEPYNHTDKSKWNSTHSLLEYIYQRDVVENRFLQSSDFFMQLFSHAVSGAAKAIISGQFEEMVRQGKTWDGLGLLKEMDDAYRDKNAEQSAAALLHACRQFKDEALSSFLPRFQQLLARSPSSTADDKQKLYQLINSLNQATQNYLIGRDQPDSFLGFTKYLSVVGSQIERVGLIKTKAYHIGQVGIFDDGTKGIAGGKLLGGNSTMPPRPLISTASNKDSDGDTQMTGVNRIRAKWVSRNEIDRRRTEGVCLRCGKKGHLISKCKFLPAKKPETEVSSVKIEDELSQDDLSIDSECQDLKD